MARSKRKSRSSLSSNDDDDNNNNNVRAVSTSSSSSSGIGVFSSQAPEMSQSILPVKESERTNLLNMTEDARNKALLDLSRLILFKALAGEPIDRLKCCKEAGISGADARISSAAFEEVKSRLENVFGFELRRYPKWMENIKKMPSKYKDRYFVVNSINIDDNEEEEGEENDDRYGSGKHSRIIVSVHTDCSIQKALLMIVLALVYCKGDPRPDGSRWISDFDLYKLLHTLDENIPSKPGGGMSGSGGSTSQGSRKRSFAMVTGCGGNDGGVALTPNVDESLLQFVHLDYLLREKITDETKGTSQTITQSQLEEGGFIYSMGPRAAIEIGRRQIIYFCAEVLDEEPDPTMLMELEADLQGEEDVDAEVAE